MSLTENMTENLSAWDNHFISKIPKYRIYLQKFFAEFSLAYKYVKNGN